MIATFPLAVLALLTLLAMAHQRPGPHGVRRRQTQMNLNRRNLIKIAGAAGAAALAGRALASATTRGAARDAVGVLVDTTRCVGCRACEAACSEANVLAAPEKPGDDAVFAARRRTGPTSFTVVNKSTAKSPAGEDRYAKTQCMHCVTPACASGCVVKALEKTALGAGRVPRGPLPRLPLLHDRLPVRRAEVRVHEGGAPREEVHVLRGAPGKGPAARVHGRVPLGRAHVREALRPPRGGQDPHLPEPVEVRPRDLRRGRSRRNELALHLGRPVREPHAPAGRREEVLPRDGGRRALGRPVHRDPVAAAPHGSLHLQQAPRRRCRPRERPKGAGHE